MSISMAGTNGFGSKICLTFLARKTDRCTMDVPSGWDEYNWLHRFVCDSMDIFEGILLVFLYIQATHTFVSQLVLQTYLWIFHCIFLHVFIVQLQVYKINPSPIWFSLVSYQIKADSVLYLLLLLFSLFHSQFCTCADGGIVILEMIKTRHYLKHILSRVCPAFVGLELSVSIVRKTICMN